MGYNHREEIDSLQRSETVLYIPADRISPGWAPSDTAML